MALKTVIPAQSSGAASSPAIPSGDRFRRNHHVLFVPAVEADAGDLLVQTQDEVSAAAILTNEAMPTVPAHAHLLPWLPLRDPGSHGIDVATDFMAGNAGILDSRKKAFLGSFVAVTDSAGVDFDANLSGTGLRDVALDNFKRRPGLGDLDNLHASHMLSLEILQGQVWNDGGND
jgi:hypothetical protein